jgi:GDP-L-fucose synthase
MTKILITGGTGLVGNGLKNIINKTKYTTCFMSSKHCNLENENETIIYFQEMKPDIVIHLAACVGGLFKNMTQKVKMLESNVKINMNVLKASHLSNVKKVISCLSTCVFPDKISYPINETMLHNGPPHSSNDAYAYAKRLLEIQSKAYQKQYNKDFICIIPTNIYGPYDNFSLTDGHVIPSLIHRCYLAKKNNENFIVKGSGKPLRQFIHSYDLAKLIMIVIEKYNERDSIILSVDEKQEVSIKDIATYIAKAFDYENKIVFDKKFSDGQYKKTADNSKIMKLTKFEFIPIEKGIYETVKWFQKNFNICRK